MIIRPIEQTRTTVRKHNTAVRRVLLFLEEAACGVIFAGSNSLGILLIYKDTSQTPGFLGIHLL
jgi:hypothetical protein